MILKRTSKQIFPTLFELYARKCDNLTDLPFVDRVLHLVPFFKMLIAAEVCPCLAL